MDDPIAVETNQEYVDLLKQLAMQNDILNEQITVTNEYMTTVVTVLFYLSMLASFMVAYWITKGRK